MDATAANAKLRWLLDLFIESTNAADKRDRDWRSTDIEEICEKMEPLWRAVGAKHPGVWIKRRSDYATTPLESHYLSLIVRAPDSDRDRSVVLESGEGLNQYVAPARVVLDFEWILDAWMRWLEIQPADDEPIRGINGRRTADDDHDVTSESGATEKAVGRKLSVGEQVASLYQNTPESHPWRSPKLAKALAPNAAKGELETLANSIRKCDAWRMMQKKLAAEKKVRSEEYGKKRV